MEPDMGLLAALFPDISEQLRSTLSNLHLAAAQLAPAADREADPVLDGKAALLDQSCYRMLRLVNNLTALAALEDEPPKPQRDWDLVEIVSAVFESSVSLAELLGIRLSFSCAMEHCVCAVCREDLEQILYQLLSNALKFTPRGGEVRLELKRGGDRLLLSVMDTGCGIPEDRMEALFEVSARKEELPLSGGGLGLGLPLARRLALRMGGNLLLQSTVGAGSCFALSLPEKQARRVELSDVPFVYEGGFSRTLLALSDALPPEAFHLRDQS